MGGLSVGRVNVENGEKAWIEKHNWQAQNREGDVKNRIGNAEAKELTYTTHGHELRRKNSWREWGYQEESGKGRKLGELQEHNQ